MRFSPPRTVFRDFSTLSFDYVPERLPGREAQAQRLATLYRPVVEAGVPVHALLHGSVGTGKTHTARRFSAQLIAEASGRQRTIQPLVVNCRQKFTADDVTLSMVRNFQEHFPTRGFSVAEKLDAFRRDMQKRRTHVLLVLDEVDVLLKKSGPDLIYALTRLGEETAAGGRERVSLLLIAPTAEALDRLDAATRSTFRRTNVVEFPRYTAEELRRILKQRCELALHPSTFTDEVVDLIADIAAEYGDARYAIEILQNAGSLADEEKSPELSAEHVRGAKASVHPTDVEEKVRDLDRAHALALLAVARRIRRKAYLVTSEAEESYGLACEEYGTTARGHTQFWKYLKDLEALGLIDSKVITRTARGAPGKTTVISLPEIPAQVLVEKLERKLG